LVIKVLNIIDARCNHNVYFVRYCLPLRMLTGSAKSLFVYAITEHQNSMYKDIRQ